MIILKCGDCQIAFPRKEYAITLSYGRWPNGQDSECLDIYTPARKYSLMGIESSGVDSFELLDQVLERIQKNPEAPSVYIDLGEICDNIYPLAPLSTSLEVS